LWFHDAVYRPISRRNEKNSARWAASFLLGNGASKAQVERVSKLILVTEHTARGQTRDEAAMLDIDLSILGAAPPVYADFEQAIRKEFWFVPGFVYRRKRADLLRGFLGRHRIYVSGLFADAAETQAKANLLDAVQRLERRLGTAP
jgi:predicted metal-dependent HD superfamily phosphohydrolase